MKAITVRQPFAELIAVGAKRTEHRRFRPLSIIGKARGRLAIHAGAYRPTDTDVEKARQLAREDPDVSWKSAKRVLDQDPESWAYQRVVAVVTVGEPRPDGLGKWRWPLSEVRRTTSARVSGRPGLFPVPAGKIRTKPAG